MEEAAKEAAAEEAGGDEVGDGAMGCMLTKETDQCVLQTVLLMPCLQVVSWAYVRHLL
jgi:hypothetical protein